MLRPLSGPLMLPRHGLTVGVVADGPPMLVEHALKPRGTDGRSVVACDHIRTDMEPASVLRR